MASQPRKALGAGSGCVYCHDPAEVVTMNLPDLLLLLAIPGSLVLVVLVAVGLAWRAEVRRRVRCRRGDGVPSGGRLRVIRVGVELPGGRGRTPDLVSVTGFPAGGARLDGALPACRSTGRLV